MSVTYDDDDSPATVESTVNDYVEKLGMHESEAVFFFKIANGELESDSVGYDSVDDVPKD